ncbi:Uncharacterised protein [Mycobacteroides abscessus subsp. abscessus]|nr:Uncharacterised protein [Mycobacteroides abscessus subsp. abscessus]
MSAGRSTPAMIASTVVDTQSSSAVGLCWSATNISSQSAISVITPNCQRLCDCTVDSVRLGARTNVCDASPGQDDNR